MAPAQWKLEQGEQQYGTPYQRLPGQLPRQRADRRRRLRLGRRDRPVQGRAAHRRRRHRPADHADRRRAEPRPALRATRGSPGTSTTAGRSSRRTDKQVRPDPVRAARLADAGQRRLADPAGVFLFTEQALTAARDHLTPDGAFAMYNYYREDWLIDRLAGTAATAFGHTPCVDLRRRARPSSRSRSTRPTSRAARPTRPAGAVIAPATDDRPFLYFQGGSIPALYLWTLAGILLISLIARAGARRAVPRRCGPTPTCSSWARRSCCWRPRTSRRSRCCSAPPGWSTRWSSPACW